MSLAVTVKVTELWHAGHSIKLSTCWTAAGSIPFVWKTQGEKLDHRCVCITLNPP